MSYDDFEIKLKCHGFTIVLSCFNLYISSFQDEHDFLGDLCNGPYPN